jgi:nucleoside-triphosphatase THEP1
MRYKQLNLADDGKQRMSKQSDNPFRAGAGHSPPHLAGRDEQREQFSRLLDQDVITQNIILTGLRGVGKTVLMDDVYKPLALKKHWVWVGSDLSEAAFVDERSLCLRLLTDLSLFTSQLKLVTPSRAVGYRPRTHREEPLTFEFLIGLFDSQPGLMADKLKATLEFVWETIQSTGKRGILFAYDESQVVQDRRDKDQYPLALLLEVFQSLQRKGLRYMLLLTGLPTLFPRLVECRTYAERMFVVQEIGPLETAACQEAITKPLKDNRITFTAASVKLIVSQTQCYPYFVQFMCREAYDYFRSCLDSKPPIKPTLPISSLIRKLDADFFSGRWNRATDRQREMLLCIANRGNAEEEFTIGEIVQASKMAVKKWRIRAFKTADVSQMLLKLIESGLVLKTRHGKYSLAVPLFDAFILRQFDERALAILHGLNLGSQEPG